MDEAERCSQIAFMDAGRITHSGTPDELKAAVPGAVLEVAAPDPRAALSVLADAPGVASANLLGDVVRVLTVAGEPSVAAALRNALADAGIEAEVRPVATDMESVFSYLAEGVPA